MTNPLTIMIGMGPGLGQALVRRFARGGHRVAFIGRRAGEIRRWEEKLTADGLDVAGYVGDAGNPVVMADVFERIRAAHGDAQTLIYNAALIEPARFATPSRLDEVKYGSAPGWASLGEPASVDYVNAAFQANVAGALFAAQSLAPAMVRRGAGVILLTGGVLAFEPWIEWGVTSLCKAALRSLGRSLDKELVDAGVHVCTIAIHGTMQAGTPYDHDLVADAYWEIAHQPRDAWRAEHHFRSADADGSDPDA